MNRRVVATMKGHVAGMTLMLALGRASVAQSPAQPPAHAAVLGTWRGTSVCLVRPSPCNDEIVVYRIAPTKAADSVTLDARKIVRGAEEEMGVLACRLAPVNQLTCTIPRGVWHFTVRNDSLTGEARLLDDTRYREVRAVRDNSTMRPLRYSINVTLDGCCDHRVGIADEDLHRNAIENIEWADALLFGRVTYGMMEEAWRQPAPTEGRPAWMEPFGRTIDAAKKYVVSSTLKQVDWNAELIRGDLRKAVEQLKAQPGRGLLTGGVTLPQALAELGLIDEYELVVHPRIVGRGPTLFAGLSKMVDLKLVSQSKFASGAVAMRYELRR